MSDTSLQQTLPSRRTRLLAPPLLALPAVLFLVVFFVLPLIDNGMRSVIANDGGFTLSRYASLLTDGFYLWIIAQTVLLSAGVTIISIIIGYPVAYFLVRKAGRFSGLIIFLLIAPLLTSIIMRTFGWQVLFARRGLVNNLLVDQLGILSAPLRLTNSPEIAIAALVHVLVPFMVLSIATVLQGIDTRLEESAKILGANRLRTFFEVTLPLSLDGIGTGAILVFMIANGSFVTLVLLGGGMQTLPLMIYQQFNTTRDFGMASAMSMILLVIAVFCLFLQLRLVRRKGA
ncbi:ABC transporter permease [Neorhizobium alkalisoli]|uniref:Putative spermidine/putrescine transport system permease protein n=1 Tax=Neorhizobium alkalisoli TaxID=528178 RepID=A0A561QPN3_9HYPH|nr:ABC transporter permease [Neorhizobium alkalisoli]TWF52358.1 putative spermidine/putrescine transport system permease protein [Neorhizobium alkalisoli]